MIRNFALSVFLLLPIFTSSQEHGPAKATPADAIYIHAKIYTGVVGMSSTQEIKRAQALAIRGERIVAVGSNEEVLQQKGPATTVIDLQGHFVMPGFNDAHMHLADAGFKQLTVDLTGTRSLAEFQQRIRQHVGSARPGEWITGSGWDETLWQVKKLPTRADIDKVAAGHPVYVERIDGHVSVVNTLALKIAKVTEASQAPAGGEIGRDPSGQPNGILRETARDLIEPMIPPPSEEQRRRAIEIALADIAQSGVTSVQDNSDSEGGEAYWQDFQIFEQLESEGKLTARIYEWQPFAEPLDVLDQRRASHSQSDLMLRTGMLKGYLDGSLGSRTAALLEPYADDPKNSGLARYQQSRLNELAKERLASGFQLGFHAIGDRAVEMALDAFAEAEGAARAKGVTAQDGTSNYRLRIEHAQVTNPQQVARFRELHVIASMQPSHLLTDMRWAGSRLGPARAAHSYAWAELLDHGVTLAFGTDYPVEPVSPFRGLYAAVTRHSEDGKRSYFPEQELTMDQALAAYTTGSAYAEFAEKDKGTLTPGMLGDFVVLDRDLTALPPAKILGTRVLRTVVGGKTVYQSDAH